MIENTTQTNPLILLAEAAMNPNGHIEAMEKRGQEQLVQSDLLPTNTHGKDADFIALGFTFGEPVQGDPMFRNATLPAGWSRRGSSHSMWSYIMDERGIDRVSIFYKAAFYDRSAHMSLNQVGGGVVGEAIYEEVGEPSIPKWSLLTDAEKADGFKVLEEYKTNAARYPDIYGKRTARVEAIEKLMAN